MAKTTTAPEDASSDYEGSASTPEAKAKVKRNPIKAVVTFDLIDPDGKSVELPPGHRIVVRNVERDLLKFADAVLDSPSSVGLFAKIEIPFAA